MQKRGKCASSRMANAPCHKQTGRYFVAHLFPSFPSTRISLFSFSPKDIIHVCAGICPSHYMKCSLNLAALHHPMHDFQQQQEEQRADVCTYDCVYVSLRTKGGSSDHLSAACGLSCPGKILLSYISLCCHQTATLNYQLVHKCCMSDFNKLKPKSR